MRSTSHRAACLLLTEEVWGSALRAMRGLGAQGIPVYVATLGEGSGVFGRSRYCSDAHDVSPELGDGFCADALTWADRRHPGTGPMVVIPLSDRLVELLDRHRAEVPERFRLSLPASDVVQPLLDKEASLQLAEQAGLRVPPWVAVRSEDDLPAASHLPLPVGVRPTSWATGGRSPTKITVHHDRAALEAGLRDQLGQGAELLAQHHLDVPDDAVEFGITWRSPDRSVSVACTGRKRRQSTPGGGVMVWGETAELPDVDAAAQRFLDISGFTGLGGIELIRSGGGLHFIEFNPRLEAIHFLAQRAGMDTVLMEFRALAGGDLQVVHPATVPATAWVGSAWLNRLLVDGSQRGEVLRDRWRFARSPGRVRAVWDRSDPLPVLALAARLTGRLLRRLSAARRSTR